MGFLKSWLGTDSGSANTSSAVYTPSSYTTSVGSPSISTNTTVSKAEDAKVAENPDTSDYEEAVKRRRKRNGVSGSFASGAGDTSGVSVQNDAMGK